MSVLFYESPIGRILLEEQGETLTRLQFCRQGEAVDRASVASSFLREAVRQLEEYFKGNRREFDLPLSPQGTDFQRRVWTALLDIRFGETASYGDVARAIESPKACRAVGMACHVNPLMVVIPCHRVLAAGGRIGGYAGGLEVKRFLLKLEKGLR